MSSVIRGSDELLAAIGWDEKFKARDIAVAVSAAADHIPYILGFHPLAWAWTTRETAAKEA